MPTPWRLFLTYAGVSLAAVLLLGVLVSFALGREAEQRGIGQARAEATLLAHASVEPVLDGRSLDRTLPENERQHLAELTDRVTGTGSVVRLRLRNTTGRVVFSDDGADAAAEPEAIAATRGITSADLTHLNSDRPDSSSPGPRVVEVYVPLTASGRILGVLEIYLPYAPILQDITSGIRTLYVVLGAGLVALWAILGAISASTMRRLAHVAEYDALTGLPNRLLFQRRAASALDAARRDGSAVAVVLADVDRFKEVNDTLGHQVGDALLRELGARLAANIRSGDTVSRLGGDEFGLVLPDIGAEEIRPLLDRLREALEAEAVVGTLPLWPEASFGYALSPADGTDVDTLLRRADVAMYLAKGTRTGTARYDPGRDHYDAAQLSLVAELRRAIENGELVLYYQPKANLRTGDVCAAEALVRWQHPTRGIVAPDAFLPVAEQTGLIDALTDWVLRAALTQIVAWGPAYEGLDMSVNVSARNLAHADFADSVLAALTASGVPASRLVVEITETALMTDPEEAADVLTQLTAAGVRISVDDFGQGQTSLSYLATLPLHELKIDKSFVSDLPSNRAHAAIVRSVVDLGHNLGLQVVAEGIETHETAALLAEAGCDIAQGYLMSRPLPADAFASWLAEHRTAALT